MRQYLLLFLTIFFMGNECLLAQSGQLDPNFGNNGQVNHPLEQGAAMCVAFLPDGKLLVAGTKGSGVNPKFIHVMQLKPDGSLDNSFGDSGQIATHVQYSGNAGEHLMKLQPDGKIVVAGFTLDGDDQSTALARFLPDGSPDNGFGNGGVASHNIDEFGDGEAAYSVAIQPDGKMVTGGVSSPSQFDTDYTLVRFNADGSLDTGFGQGGVSTLPLPSSYDNIWHLLVQPDGKLLATGYTNYLLGFTRSLARFNADGSMDTGFGNNGLVSITGVNGAGFQNSLAIAPDGGIVLAGVNYLPSGTGLHMVINRFLANGQKDTGFGTNGRVTFEGENIDPWGAMTVQPDGKLLVLVRKYQPFAITLHRLLADGSPDPEFATGGSISHNLGLQPASMQLDNELRIVVVGGEQFSAVRFGSGLSSAQTQAGPFEGMAIYPNPTPGSFRLDFELRQAAMVSIRIYDSYGRLVREQGPTAGYTSGNHSTLLDLGQSPAGLYTLVLDSDLGSARQVVVKW